LGEGGATHGVCNLFSVLLLVFVDQWLFSFVYSGFLFDIEKKKIEKEQEKEKTLQRC
jgi:hypothetical protein